MGDADGSITSIYTVLAEFELGNDPIVELARATLDGQIMLSRDLADSGVYPAIDLRGSISRLADKVVGDSHLENAVEMRSYGLCTKRTKTSSWWARMYQG